MSKNEFPKGNPVSRRNFLGVAAAGGGALLGLSLIGSPAAASGKLSQKAVHYQSVPKAGNRCANCALWQMPASCKSVEGPISPAGWCLLYAPKK
jgi:hypothetical protein